MARQATPNNAMRPSLKLTEFAAGNPKEAMKSLSANTRPIYMVPIEHLHIAPGFNVRVTDTVEYRTALEALKRSIQQEGFYNTKPLAGFVARTKEGENVVFVTDGHRRLEAARQAAAEGTTDLDKLPVILKPASASGVDLAVALHLENSGQELTMLEKAVLVKRMLNAGMDEKEVAEKLDMTTRYISDLMLLVTAPKTVRSLVSEGKVAGTLAVKELRAAERTGRDPATRLAEIAGKKEGRIKPADVKHARDEPGVKMQIFSHRYELVKGSLVSYDEIARYRGLIEDSDWYSHTDEEGLVRAEEDVQIDIRIRRPKHASDGLLDGAVKKRGRPVRLTRAAALAAKEDEEDEDNGVGVEVDPMTMEPDEPEPVPIADLERLGIADPAADL